MPRCRSCHREITRFDDDVCPYCGEAHPIEDGYLTKDMTKFIDPVEGSNSLYKSKRKIVYLLLSFFLGAFGAGDIYLGRLRAAAATFLLTSIFVAGLGTALYFLVPSLSGFAFLIAYALPFAVSAGKSAYLSTRDDLKDSNGEFLR